MRSNHTIAPLAFAALIASQQFADILPADIWPINSVGWDMVQGQLLPTLKHHAAKLEPAPFPATPELLALLAL